MHHRASLALALLSMSLTLATAVAAALGVERCVWYAMGGVAALLFIAAVYVWTTPSAQGRERATLDRLIRDGQSIRERIVQERMSDDDARDAAMAWMDQCVRILAEQFPAYADQFRLAAGDHTFYSGQALVIQTINAKLTILRQAHSEWRP